MSDERDAITKRRAIVHAALMDAKVLEQLGKAAPHADPQEIASAVWNACNQSTKLMGCSTASLVQAALDSARLGLPVGSVVGYAYIVPYKGKAQLQAGYQGLLRLAYNDGRAKMAAAEVVREGDELEFVLGTSPSLDHVPKLVASAGRPIIAAYAVVTSNGEPFVSIAPIADLDEHARQYVRMTSDGNFPADALYRTNPVAWYKKTMMRRVLKWVPMSEYARQVLNSEDYIEQGLPIEEGMQSGDEQTTDSLRAALGIEAEADEVEYVNDQGEVSAGVPA